MRNRIIIQEYKIAGNQSNSSLNAIRASQLKPGIKDALLKIFADESRESFFNYIDWLGFAKDPNLVILSSMHHYYYDEEEMKKARTLVNMKELNKIKHSTSFIHSIFHIMQPKSYFIGCFVDNKKHTEFAFKEKSIDNHSERDSQALENGIISRYPFLNMIFRYMDSKTNKYLSGKEVTSLLSDHGFKVLDMTELDGITYFCAQKLPSVVN